jgi:hypothetical protein
VHNLDGLRATLGAAHGETVYEAAERVVRERDAALRAANSELLRWTGETMGKVAAEAQVANAKAANALAPLWDFSQWRDYSEGR